MPELNENRRIQIPLCNFFPANHGFSVGLNNFFKAIHKLDVILFFSHLRFITTYMEIWTRSDSRDLTDHVINKLKRCFFFQAKRTKTNFDTMVRKTSNGTRFFTWLKFNRRSGKEFVRVRNQCSVDVTRKIYFRNDCDKSALCIGNDILVLFLGVKSSFTTANLTLSANSRKVGP